MGESVNLQKTGLGWEFETEAALEDFVWANLPRLFNLTPLQRQQEVKGQFCDILGLGENHQLAVLELKNAEDRYIVQQITRYYDAVREEKPFAESVDYNLPIRLIAITPSFHRDNFTDRKYCHLDIDFLQFEVIADGEKFYLQLRDVESDRVWQIEIPHEERVSDDDIPPVPKRLQKILSQFEPGQQENILKFRHKILTFDKRMEEFSSNGNISYGSSKGKNVKLCAELYTNSQGIMIPFLWLPLKCLTSEKIGRARIGTDWNDLAVVEGYVSKGIGTKISLQKKRIAKLVEKMMSQEFADVNPQDIKCFSPQQHLVVDVDLLNRASINYVSKLWMTSQSLFVDQAFWFTASDAIKNINKSNHVTWEDVKLLELYMAKVDAMLNSPESIKYPPKYGSYGGYYWEVEFIGYFANTLNSTYSPTICPYLYLDYLIDLALKKWLARI